MGELRKIAPKAMLLLLLLAGMNLVYEQWLLPADIAAYSESGALVQAIPDSTQVLYLGESSNLTFADEDVEKLPVSKLLARQFPGVTVADLSKGALHLGNYLPMLRAVPRSIPVHAVVVTVNLRSFNAGWVHSKLETALQKEMVLLRRGPALWRRLMLSLRAYEIKSEEERLAETRMHWRMDTLRFPGPFPFATAAAWDSACDARARAGGPEQGRWVLATHFVKAYAFQIDSLRHPRIADLDGIVELARERGWTLVLNLLPENVQEAESLLGPELVGLMRQNRDLLRRRYGGRAGVHFLDQLEALPADAFIDRDRAAEHYFEQGRQVVAANVALALKGVFPEHYREPVQVALLPKWIFQNDCEGGEAWGQMQTLDDARAHSGSKASLTRGPDSQFGVTFSQATAKLDSLRMDSLAFSCWVWAEADMGTAAVAWEAGGERSGYLWDSLQLRGLGAMPGRWSQVRFRVPLWPGFREAEVFKTYPYNPSTVPVWFDDIRVEFLAKRP